mgnify:CR=1 FL=1
MKKLIRRVGGFLTELKRRRVYRAVAAYVVFAIAALEVVLGGDGRARRGRGGGFLGRRVERVQHVFLHDPPVAARALDIVLRKPLLGHGLQDRGRQAYGQTHLHPQL